MIDPQAMPLRLILARAFAEEHGSPLGFHDEEDQLAWDGKAQAVLRDLADAIWDGVPFAVGQTVRHHTGSVWEVVSHLGGRYDDYRMRLVSNPPTGYCQEGEPAATERTFHGEYMHRTFRGQQTPASEGKPE